MSGNIHYEDIGEISGKTPLESFYEAMRPLLKNYGLTAEFPADKPSLVDSINDIEFSVLIGVLPAAISYKKWQESPYRSGGIELTLEGETLVHAETGGRLFFKIFITDYISGMSKPAGTFWLTFEFRGAESEVAALKKAIAPVLEKYRFHSRGVKNSIVPDDPKDNFSAPPPAANSAVEKAVEAIKFPDGVNFDALSLKATQTNAREDLNDLFGEAFALTKWHFISRGELPNVHPYVAANAQYADNQPMIRAFTDTKRLMRFAKENNLTKPDGSCDVLTIPTDNIIPYLEGFIPSGAYGIWFNSDTESDGFFIPIKQLRPIKEYLTKINWQKNAPKKPVETLQFVVKEGLMLPSAEIKPAPYTSNFFWRVPADWVENGQIKAEHLRKIEREMSGGRSETIEGAFYVVIDYSTKVFEPEAVKAAKWNDIVNDDDNLYCFFVASENGEIKKVTAEEFQADVDASFQAQTKDAAQPRQSSNLGNWGLAESPDGGIEQMLTVNRVGAVNFDASIAPFYEAIVPMLADYQGTGEFVGLLRFEPSGKSEQVENIIENAHGAYLQIRRFLYLNPKNNVRIGVNSIHSSELRHVQSNGKLLVSFELCKNLDDQTAAFYFAFLGAGSEVKKLANAIQPLLESVNYQPVQ